MNAVPFDTLKLARDLESAGLAATVAAGAAAAPAEALMAADFATKSDLAAFASRLTAEIRSLRAEAVAFEGRVEAKFGSLASHMDEKFDAKLEILRRDMTVKMGSMFIIAVGILLAAMRFMPHP